MLQFLQSLSDRLTSQDNPHPHFLHIQFHDCNYLRFCPPFALIGKHGLLSLCFDEVPTIQNRVLTNLFNIDQPEVPRLSENRACTKTEAQISARKADEMSHSAQYYWSQ